MATHAFDRSERHDADLLVLGFHGRTHTETEQAGGVTDRVVQNAGRPVLVAA